MRLSEVPQPESEVASAALEIATAYSSPALLNHCSRSYVWAASYAVMNDLTFDAELLYVASLLHDIGLTREFDNHTLSFEHAGAAIAWVFGAGAGWPTSRRKRVGDAIIAHMAAELVAPDQDTEGHLLSVATSLDISGARLTAWPEPFRAEVLTQFPRLGLAGEFIACFQAQAARKPASSPASAIHGGIAHRASANPLDDR